MDMFCCFPEFVKQTYVFMPPKSVALLSFATPSLCPVCATANDTGWPTVGKTGTSLKPPERRDSGSDTQGKSPPSGSPVAQGGEKVSSLQMLSSDSFFK